MTAGPSEHPHDDGTGRTGAVPDGDPDADPDMQRHGDAGPDREAEGDGSDDGDPDADPDMPRHGGPPSQ